jgi:BON domain-containing protein
MAYEEQQSKRSRVVVETPSAHREVVESHVARIPERGGVSGGTVGVIVVLAVALVTILVLLLLSGRSIDNSNVDVASQSAPVPQTTIVQQPAPQQPVIIQQPAPVTQPAPVIVNPAGGNTTPPVNNDAAIQADVEKTLSDDTTLGSLGITVSVLDGKATLIGAVKNESLKADVERLVRRVRGVKSIDNQISVLP